MKKQVTLMHTDKQGNHHRVDTAGNYFVNGKCQNPKCTIEGNEIGYNIPQDVEWVEHDTNVAENIVFN